MTNGEFLVFHGLNIGAIDFREDGWLLKCGRLSPYFFDAGKFCDGASFSVLTRAYAQILRQKNVRHNTVLLGPPYKGTLLVPGVTLALCDYGVNVRFASWRKESKLHGEQGQGLGSSLKGSEVIIIDDVMTDGGTAENSIRHVVANGGRVVAYVVAFNREEKEEKYGRLAAQAILESFDVPVYAIAKLSELISVLRKENSSRSEKFLPKILEYQEKHGIPTK